MDPKQQKLIMIGLSLIGVAALSLGIAQFKKNLSSPFIGYEPIGSERAQQIIDSYNTGSETDASVLKTQDSDGDGLTDYDEIYIYNTNPYSDDSDGDGFKDKEEIDSKNDPNCPRGKICEKKIVSPAPATSTDSNIDTNITAGSAVLQNISADTLRQYLREAGLSDDTLSKFDDTTLKSLYLETLAGKAQTTTTKTTTIEDEAALREAVNNLPMSQVRTYLGEQGVSAEKLAGFGDEQLRTMLLDSVTKK